jgi:hypothetical protein
MSLESCRLRCSWDRVSDPQQDGYDAVDHDQDIPRIEVSPLEPFHRVLPDIEKANDSNKVHANDGGGTRQHTDQSQFPCGREREHRRADQNYGLETAAAVVDSDGKTGNRGLNDVIYDSCRSAKKINQASRHRGS